MFLLGYNKDIGEFRTERVFMKKKNAAAGGRDVLDNFEAQFKKSTLPLMLLTLLSEQEQMYAYEITQECLRRTDGIYKMPLLYTTLSKLLEQGFVEEVGKTISESNRVRVYYRITEEGISHLYRLKSLYVKLSRAVQSVVYTEKERDD